VVLLFTGDVLYQETFHQEYLRYGDGDISEGSLVFSRSKDEKAGDEPLPS